MELKDIKPAIARQKVIDVRGAIIEHLEVLSLKKVWNPETNVYEDIVACKTDHVWPGDGAGIIEIPPQFLVESTQALSHIIPESPRPFRVGDRVAYDAGSLLFSTVTEVWSD